MNNIYFVLIALVPIIYIVNEIRKKRFSIKESFWWMMASIAMLLLAIFPKTIDFVAKLIGVEYPPTLLFVLCIIFLIFINFRNSKRISEQQIKIIELAQHVSILKSKIDSK